MYGIGDSLPLNLVPTAAATTPRAATYGKPVHLSEVGIDFRGPSETRAADPTGKGVHEGAWIGLFSGGAGAGMPWWWDGVIEPDDLYGTMLDGLDALLDGVDVPAERFAGGGATAASDLGTIDVFTLGGRTTALVWLRNPSDWWHQPDERAVAATRLTVEGLAAGTWRTTLVDPFPPTGSDVDRRRRGDAGGDPPVTSDGGPPHGIDGVSAAPRWCPGAPPPWWATATAIRATVHAMCGERALARTHLAAAIPLLDHVGFEVGARALALLDLDGGEVETPDRTLRGSAPPAPRSPPPSRAGWSDRSSATPTSHRVAVPSRAALVGRERRARRPSAAPR